MSILGRKLYMPCNNHLFKEIKFFITLSVRSAETAFKFIVYDCKLIIKGDSRELIRERIILNNCLLNIIYYYYLLNCFSLNYCLLKSIY